MESREFLVPEMLEMDVMELALILDNAFPLLEMLSFFEAGDGSIPMSGTS